MLEKILNHYGPIKWHKIDKNFEEYFKEKGPSNFYRVNAEIYCCSDCARSDKNFTVYRFYVKDNENLSREFEVPRKYDEGDDRVYALFEFDEKGVLHGWIHRINIPFYHMDKKDLSDFLRCLYTRYELPGEKMSGCEVSVLKEYISKKLSISNNPETQRKLVEIKERYKK